MRVPAFLALTFAVLAAQPAAAAPGGPSAEGLWMNPYRSVAVRAGPCGDRLCGWVVWASADAQADARDSGVDRLIGTELLQDYRRANLRAWHGTVYIPDMGRRFYSEIDQLSAGQLKVKGCILGGLVCKSQMWTRIDAIPN